MSEEHFFFRTPDTPRNIILRAGIGPELRIQPDGIIYKGVKVEDAGEVYKALCEVLSGHMPAGFVSEEVIRKLKQEIRKVLKHHKLTEHGDGVVEADLADLIHKATCPTV